MSKNTRIVKVRKNKSGEVKDVMLENGNVFPMNHAILLAKDGVLEGVNVVRGKNGGEYLKPEIGAISGDNLNDLPTFR